jgi:hypothetical protein
MPRCSIPRWFPAPPPPLQLMSCLGKVGVVSDSSSDALMDRAIFGLHRALPSIVIKMDMATPELSNG